MLHKRLLTLALLLASTNLLPAQTTTVASPALTVTVTGATLAAPLIFGIPSPLSCSTAIVPSTVGGPLSISVCNMLAAASCPPFSDAFARANGPLGVNWASSPGAAIQVIKDAASEAAYSAGTYSAWVAACSFTNSQHAQMTLTSVDIYGHFGGVVSASSAGQYSIDCTTSGGCGAYNSSLASPYLGTFADSKGNAVGPVVGNAYCAELVAGNTLKLKLNGVYSATTFPVSGVPLGAPGMEFGSQSASPAVLNSFSAANGPCP